MRYGVYGVAMGGDVFYNSLKTQRFDGSFINCIYEANYSAAALVNLLAKNFSCFRDETTFEGRPVHLYKRAQILVADLWACFEGNGYGEFRDIDKITMFAGMCVSYQMLLASSILLLPLVNRASIQKKGAF
jgi:hypothetical protein